MKRNGYTIIFTFFAFVLAFAAQSSYAQTTRRQPPPDVPVIISRAEDESADDYVVQPETPQDEEPSESDAAARLERANERIRELTERIKTLESGAADSDEAKQKRLLMNLDILSRAESRAETLRKQLFEMLEKENSIKARMDQIDYDLRPEVIRMQTATTGSLRPEDVRDARQKSLSAEKTNLQSLLSSIETRRAALELSVQRAELLVEKVRLKFEKEIDEALDVETEP